MITIKTGKICFALLITISLTSCHSGDESKGPYFGNGFHNGWADQTSIVIWTRLTKNEDGNSRGEKFLVPTAEAMKELYKDNNETDILSAQIPEGFLLNDMDGACPGASGEVKLEYYPEDEPDLLIETDWIKVDDAQNYTTQWKLEDLIPDTPYLLKIAARANAGSAISDEIEGVFKTPPSAQQERDIDFCIVTCHDYLRKDSEDKHHCSNRYH